MLGEILAHINNYFVTEIKKGGYEIFGGTIALPFLRTNQYFRISGSIFNDGVYKYPVDNLIDETFDGEIWALAVPQELVTMSEEIQTWQANNPATAYTSESFGGYSYSKATDDAGIAAGWREVYRTRLNRWRKL